ncbi:MAG: gliding motility-associated C-terminal domain-containing protein [Bacteroidetes bacterium]|nr:gliding motility-associated C-terminal domain-containing protein [Bacteroidota bacterium]
MKRLLFLCIVFLGISFHALATHQRAGEITFKYISGLTYEVTIVSYSYAPSRADRNELEINWGDGTTSILTRGNGPSGYNPANIYCDFLGEIVGKDIKKNLYTGQHTFPGPSTYKISLEDPNRNYGIQNIPSSVDIPLYVESSLTINPFVGPDNSPQLLLPPIDQGCVGHPFIHNPGAYDPDGDSLSYSLVACRGTGGQPIPGYVLPNQVVPGDTSHFTMNALTGDIYWSSPSIKGEYNIAFLIEEWRNGIRIGYITRDMQITIDVCEDNAPVIHLPPDTCITAGDTLNFKVFATDADSDKMILSSTGAPFLFSSSAAEFTIVNDTNGYINGIFNWATACYQIRKNPYQVYFKAVDQTTQINLFDIKSMNIKVVGPKTRNLSATPLGNSIRLTWDQNRCSNAVKYQIYRRNGFFGFIPSYCELGVPSYTGYHLIDEINASDTNYTDGSSPPGLVHGVDYCYIVVAVYPDGALSYASDEVCAQLKKDVPIITNVSIQTTDKIAGQIYLAWSKPTEIDTVQAPGPYKYLIYRSPDLSGNSFTLIDSLNELNDTIYYNNNLNTFDHGMTYRVDLYNDSPANRFLIGASQYASSDFISFQPGDNKIKINFNFNVPWTNLFFTVFRKNESTLLFDSLATTSYPYYSDTGLINGKTYCYKVKSKGSYGTAGITDPLINYSQEACAIPYDNEPPCPPVLTVEPDCENSTNILIWSNPVESCSADIEKYFIFYRPPLSASFAIIDSVSGQYNTTYHHYQPVTIAGCYSMQAVDSSGNISMMSDTVCIDIDTCGRYRLPNVFTPNQDNHNDLFTPFPFTSVEKIDMQIFNRWGKLVFKTNDPHINWDGKVMGTNQDASDGTYFYVCDVYELTLAGARKRTLKGSITLVR